MREWQGLTAVNKAVWRNTPEVIERLLGVGADLEDSGYKGLTLLLLAIENDRGLEKIQFLLDAGADTEARDPSGNTPLHRAVSPRKDSTVAALIDAGANLEVRNSEGLSPLQLARSLDSSAIIELLLDAETQRTC